MRLLQKGWGLDQSDAGSCGLRVLLWFIQLASLDHFAAEELILGSDLLFSECRGRQQRMGMIGA